MTEQERLDHMEFVIDEIKDILHENMTDDVYGKMQILASICVQLLINETFNKEDALDLLGKMHVAIIGGMKIADETNQNMWVSGPGN